MTTNDEQLFLAHILKNPVNGRILQLAPLLGVSDWWLTAGASFQTVWNVLEGRDPQAGIRDYDLFYFDEVPAVPFTGTTDAVDHFAAKTCCFAVTSDPAGNLSTYAPHGYEDLFARRIVPNPVLAPREVYEAKTQRWLAQWPSLTVLPWPEDQSGNDASPAASNNPT
ncbi:MULTISPECIES: nucleotidyltransferase family protein [unclassified Arthrobacter]|uniref:nucleotidyltransferase family protein n=1 Tax=unclassified Arthrobacter TaxID=235627 RepID=UPI0021587DFD|nr:MULTISPECIES: nucleotidyltransferase family protein [unclassified Arthrobacter]